MLGFFRTSTNTTMQSPMAISSAGMTDAAKRAPVDTAARPEKMTAGMLGGITGAMSDDEAETPVANRRP